MNYNNTCIVCGEVLTIVSLKKSLQPNCCISWKKGKNDPRGNTVVCSNNSDTTGFKYIPNYSGCAFHVYLNVLHEEEKKGIQKYFGINWFISYVDDTYKPVRRLFFMNTLDWLKKNKKIILLIKGKHTFDSYADIEYV